MLDVAERALDGLARAEGDLDAVVGEVGGGRGRTAVDGREGPARGQARLGHGVGAGQQVVERVPAVRIGSLQDMVGGRAKLSVAHGNGHTAKAT